MKNWGTLAFIAGLFCLGAAGYGAYAVRAAGSAYGFTLDTAAAFSRAIGLDSYFTPWERFVLFAVSNRVALLVAGAALAALGFGLRRGPAAKGA